MLRRQLHCFLYVLGFAVLSTIVTNARTWAAEKSQAPQVAQVTSAGGSVWGIVTDKKDGWIMVKVDNETEPIKYLIPARRSKIGRRRKDYLFCRSRASDLYKRWRCTSTRKHHARYEQAQGNRNGRSSFNKRFLGRSETQRRPARRLFPWRHRLEGHVCEVEDAE